MKKQKIKDFLPKSDDKPEIHTLQARVEARLYCKVRDKMKASGHTWDELIDACFKSYLTEDESAK